MKSSTHNTNVRAPPHNHSQTNTLISSLLHAPPRPHILMQSPPGGALSTFQVYVSRTLDDKFVLFFEENDVHRIKCLGRLELLALLWCTDTQTLLKPTIFNLPTLTPTCIFWVWVEAVAGGSTLKLFSSVWTAVFSGSSCRKPTSATAPEWV